MTTPSNFLLAMRAWKTAAKAQRNGRYTVRRGAVIWEVWNFEKAPFAISLQCDVRDFGREMNEGSVAIEMATLIDPQDPEVAGEIDDDVLDLMAADAEAIYRDWKRAVDEIGSFIFKAPPGTIEEFHDAEYRVQGIIAKTKIGF